MVTAGVSNSCEAADVSAVPARLRATTSRSTPSSWTRSSSADWNRSAGSVAQHLETKEYSESLSRNSGVVSGAGSEVRKVDW